MPKEYQYAILIDEKWNKPWYSQPMHLKACESDIREYTAEEAKNAILEQRPVEKTYTLVRRRIMPWEPVDD